VFLLAALAGATGVVVDTSDCERVRPDFPTQPVATWSSLAFCVAGVVVLAAAGRTAAPGRARAVAALLFLTGAGSFAYHGLGGDGSRVVHDATFLGLLAFVALDGWPPAGVWDTRRRWRAAGVGAALLVAPVYAPLTNVALVLVLAAALVMERRRWDDRRAAARHMVGASAAALGVGAAVYLLTRTGAPWCDPESTVQGHALWHVLAATSAGLWALATTVAQDRTAPATTSGPTTS
jgi:hypothetical protein